MIQTKERVTNIPQNRKKRSFVGYHQMVHPFFLGVHQWCTPKKVKKKRLWGAPMVHPMVHLRKKSLLLTYWELVIFFLMTFEYFFGLFIEAPDKMVWFWVLFTSVKVVPDNWENTPKKGQKWPLFRPFFSIIPEVQLSRKNWTKNQFYQTKPLI